jgi:DNA-binding NarL/FixJ family response regulator
MIGAMDIIPASILVIEKHPMMREALCAAISEEPDLRVGMLAGNGAAALQMLTTLLPDIVLLAMGNPGTDELKALKTLRQSLPGTPILALTSNEVPGQEGVALEAGACGVLTKAVSRLELIGKLREIMSDLNINAVEEVREEISL